MKKLDLFVIKAFFSTFFYVFFIIIFLLLLQQLLPYLEDLVGKNVSPFAYVKLVFYFSVVMTPIAFPISIMMSSLMAFGNMGEHLELTAMKCSGISLPRIMRSVFILSVISVVFAYLSNNFIVPKAALQAYSTIYNIKHTNPAFELKEGIFYNGLPGFSIKIKKKSPSGKSLKGIYIYDHTKSNTNDNIIMADSAQMYFTSNKSHLLMKLYYGNQYAVAKGIFSSSKVADYSEIEPYLRQKFDSTIIVFSMKSFEQLNVDAKAFASHRFMKNSFELLDMEKMAEHKYLSGFVNSNIEVSNRFKNIPILINLNIKDKDIKKIEELDEYRNEKDSVYRYKAIVKNFRKKFFDSMDSTVMHYEKPELIPKKMLIDSFNVEMNEEINSYLRAKRDEQKRWYGRIERNDSILHEAIEKYQYANHETLDSLLSDTNKFIYDSLNNEIQQVSRAHNFSTQLKNHFNYASSTNKKNRENFIFVKMEIQKKMALATACIVMFLIGGPLGAIVKKGGLGLPVVIAVLFFIIFYIIGTNGEKLAREEIVPPWVGAWAPVYCLLPFGLWFVIKARDDARLLEIDNYLTRWDKIKAKFFRQKNNR